MSSVSLPVWIRERKLNLGALHEVRGVMSRGGLHTVCDEARCPNRSECFARGTATFLIMGDVCTRACRYCSIAHGRPQPLDPNEPAELARAVVAMGLKHVVVTSVDRDDLPDGGAAHFAAVIAELKKLDPRPTVEVLTPDFRADMAAVDAVLAAGPDVYNHNVETVERLYPAVRRQGRYRWALEVIGRVASRGGVLVTKSGLMVGLGEAREELERTLVDLKAAGCQVVTIGQYLRPTARELPVARYWTPAEFAGLEAYGRSLGLEVIAGPFVRSSYHAEEAFLKVRG
ncbi:MAG: lipoyl synthase [Acidobacteria bacterium 21-70-11]|nr:MAG: lipoyl synthase [Acidobacteria bacterium 21-70-11]